MDSKTKVKLPIVRTDDGVTSVVDMYIDGQQVANMSIRAWTDNGKTSSNRSALFTTLKKDDPFFIVAMSASDLIGKLKAAGIISITEL